MEALLVNNKKINFNKITGEVLRTNKYSTTQVRSSGGGGVVTQHGGYVSAPTVSSTSTIHHEIWIRDDSGVEIPIKLVGPDIPLREGQVISFITAWNNKSSTVRNVALVNHSAQKHWFLSGKDLRKVLIDDEGALYLFYGFLSFSAIFIAPIFSSSISFAILNKIIGLTAAGAVSIMLGAIAFFGTVKFIKKLDGNGRHEKALDIHVETIIKQAYA